MSEPHDCHVNPKVVRCDGVTDLCRCVKCGREFEEPHVSRLTILSPRDVLETIRVAPHATTTIVDPWYNKGVGGESPGYIPWLCSVIGQIAEKSEHIFVWGFPEIVRGVLDDLPEGFELNAWLTWYYKNCPSVIRGWRSAQNACLHLMRHGAKIYPEHFLNEVQLKKKAEGKLRYMPGPPSVLEAPLSIGFVRRADQTGHPSQKPVEVIEPLIRMTTVPGDLVLDPMAGSGTTGVACRLTGRDAILCDSKLEYVALIEKRLGVRAVKSLPRQAAL
ncbi:MAG: site-specific DNA-methyltransferase [Thermoplasmata archaeon]